MYSYIICYELRVAVEIGTGGVDRVEDDKKRREWERKGIEI